MFTSFITYNPICLLEHIVNNPAIYFKKLLFINNILIFCIDNSIASVLYMEKMCMTKNLVLGFLVTILIHLSASQNVDTGDTILQTKAINAKNNYYKKTGGGTYVLTKTNNNMNGITLSAGKLQIALPNNTSTLDTEINFQRNAPLTTTGGGNLPQVLETTSTITISTITKNDQPSSYILQTKDIINGKYNTSYKIDSSHGPVDAPVSTVVSFVDTIAPVLGTKLTIITLKGSGDLRIGKADFPEYMAGNDDPVILPAATPISYPKGVTGSVEILSALPAGNYTITDGTLILNPAITSATGSITIENQAILDCSHNVSKAHLPSGSLTLKVGTNPSLCPIIILGPGTFDKVITLS